MKLLLLASSAALLVSSGAQLGCTRDDTAMNEKLASIDKRLEGIETAIKSGAGARAMPGQQPQRPRPNPNDIYAIEVGNSPVHGNASAKVTIVEGFEFACPYCRKMPPTLEQLMKDYGADLRIVKKQFVVHPQVATLPAIAACAANRQGKYPEMEEALWVKGYDANRNYSAENIDTIAKGIGLDMGKFKADMDGADCKREVQQDQAALSAVGTSGTPAFYINGRFLSGARPIEQFKAVIDEELKKANERIGKDGVTAENYYAKWVVEKGKKKLEM